MEKSDDMTRAFKEKKAELPKFEKTEQMYHPVETFSEMSKNMNKQSESTLVKPEEAIMHLKIAKNADELRKYQEPVGRRFYQLLRSL